MHNIKEKLYNELQDQNNETYLYAIVDSAIDPIIDGHFESDRPYKEILYRAENRVDLELQAPHLIILEEHHPFTERFLEEGYGNHWGCIIRSQEPFEILAEHLKDYTAVYSQEHKQEVFIRFYDPRAIGQYFPLFDTEEAEAFFSHIDEIWVEKHNDPQILYIYSLNKDSKVQREEMRFKEEVTA